MKRSDSAIGVVLLALACLVLWHVRSFPPSPGQPYNAALFPAIAAVGLAIVALILVFNGWRSRPSERIDAPDRPGANALPATAASVAAAPAPASRWLAVLLTAGSIVFYLLAANRLGFVPTGIVLLAVLMWAYGVRLARVLPLAIIATLVIHALFYKLLKVPLPWGVLQPFAW